VARRIELPSADVLFGDAPRNGAAAKPRKTAAKKATKAKPSTTKATTKKAPAARAAAKPTTAKPTTAKRAAKKTASAKPPRKPTTARAPQRRRATPEARLAAIESRLPELPVDALIDLRDNLEDLLAADILDEGAVRRLLDSVGA
jgi:hypothetical protein